MRLFKIYFKKTIRLFQRTKYTKLKSSQIILLKEQGEEKGDSVKDTYDVMLHEKKQMANSMYNLISFKKR